MEYSELQELLLTRLGPATVQQGWTPEKAMEMDRAQARLGDRETATAMLDILGKYKTLGELYGNIMAEYARYRDDAKRINVKRQYLAASLVEAFESTHRTEHVVFDDTPFVGEINGWFDMRIIAEALLANPRVTEVPGE